MESWTIKEVIDQLTGHDFAKSVLQDELESNHDTLHQVIRGISDQWNGSFRRKYVAKKDVDWQVERAMIALHTSEPHEDIVEAFQKAYAKHLMVHHVNLITEFLDTLGINHNQGELSDDQGQLIDKQALRVTEEDVDAAVEEVSKTFQLADIRLYLAVAGIVTEFWSKQYWGALAKILDHDAKAVESEHAEPTEVVPDAVIPMYSTILDDIFTKAIVESIGGEIGALSTNFIEDAIDELISLNPARYQSYFHRGFFSALISNSEDSPIPVENTPRRQWNLVGRIFGLARRSDPQDLIECWNTNSSEIVRLIIERHPAGPRILPLLFNALWVAARHSDALSLLRPEVVATCTQEFKFELLENARSHRLSGSIDDARVILDALDSAIGLGDGEEQGYVFALYRERAVCIRTQGHYEEATSLLEVLKEHCPEESEGDVEGLLGLSKAKFRAVSEVSTLVDADQANSEAERLREQMSHFKIAAKSAKPLASAIGNHCLGVLAFLDGEFAEATSMLSAARSAAVRSPQTSVNGAFIKQIQISLALAIVHAGDEPQFQQATHLLGSTQNTNLKIPEWLATRMIDNTVLVSDDTVREEMLDALVRFSPEALDHLVLQTNGQTELASQGIVETIRSVSEKNNTDGQVRWNYTSWLASRYLADGDIESANRCLDALEAIAFERPRFREQFVNLLETDDKFGDTWSSEEIAWSLAGVHEREGDYESAVSALRKQFHTYATEDRWLEAFGVFERAKNLGVANEMIEDMKGRLTAEFQSTEMPEQEDFDQDNGQTIRVLFVGGDDSQRKYDSGIQSNLAVSDPWIKVDFEHTGWSGNWGDTADRLINRFPDYDALVLMTLIRTNLGRTLRRHAAGEDLVWVSCTGAGRNFMERSIRNGAALARKRVQEN